MPNSPSRPSILYHYTSVKTLALLLSSRKIRFSRLDKCNDPLEGRSSDFDQSANLVFVTCWTANPIESIPLWRMYTGDMAGVRISAPMLLFCNEGLVSYQGNGASQRLAMEESLDTNLRVDRVFGPDRVQYTNCSRYLSPTCKVGDDVVGATYDFQPLGLAKTTAWSYEEEWRFRILIAGLHFRMEHNNSYELTRLLNISRNITNVDIPINEQAFSALEIMLGPRAGPAELKIVEALVERYCPNAKLERSNLAVR